MIVFFANISLILITGSIKNFVPDTFNCISFIVIFICKISLDFLDYSLLFFEVVV